MIKGLLKSLCRMAGKNRGKVIVVLAASASDAHGMVRYLRNQAPHVPVWLFSLESPAEKTSTLCERVCVRTNSTWLFLAAQRLLWPQRVALAAACWNGAPGRGAIKMAPFFIPPFRVLIFNEHNDSFAGRPAAVLKHVCHRWFSGDARPPRGFTVALRALLRLSRLTCGWSSPTRNTMMRRALRKLDTLNAKLNGQYERLRPYDVIVFPVIDWDWRFQRPQHLSRELGRRGHRVFYLSTTFLPVFGLSQPRARSVEKNVWVVELPASDPPPDIYRDVPSELQLAALEFGLRSLKEKFHIGATLAIVDYPFWAPLVDRLNNNVTVYDCMDDYSTFSNSGRPANELEPRMVREADLIVCSSAYLLERMRALGRDSVLVRNAADPQHFGPRPVALAIDPGRPTVGYHGAISESTDIELLAFAARSLPDSRFILIGRNDRGDLSSLESLPNVTLTGEIPYDRLPQYVHGFDVAVVPYHVCDHSRATDPVKIWEYLCAGKPVVAVRFPEIERLKDLIALTDGPEQFVDAIRSALADSPAVDVERRCAFGRENSWSSRCDAIEQAVALFFPKVSVIVLTHNQRGFTRRTLSSIDEFTCYPNLEVVLVDNASTDGTPELLERFVATHEYAKVIHCSSNLGFSAGNNIGIRASSGDYLVILNNDVCLTEGWLGTLLAHFRSDPKLGLLGPVTNRCGNESAVYVGDYDDMEEMAILAHRYTRARRGQRTALRAANFFCVMMPRAIWEQVGQLDEAFGIGLFEDDDYSMRVRAAGYGVACAEDVFVHHHGSASIGTLPPASYSELFDRNRRYFESKWNSVWTPPVFRKEVQEPLVQRNASPAS